MNAVIDAGDVLVVGGGPGGAVCARELARANVRVTLLDKGSAGRYKPCAGGISPASSRITPLPDEIVERVIDSVRLVAPGGAAVTLHPSGKVGQIVSRDRYDRYLQQLAAQSGAAVCHQAQVRDLSFSADRVEAQVLTPEGPKRFAARALVGAFGSGCRPLLARLGVEPPPSIVTVMLELHLDPQLVDSRIGNTVECYLDSRLTHAGSTWLFPRGSGLTAGIMTSVPSDGPSYRDKLLRFVDEHPVASAKCRGWQPAFGSLKRSLFGHLIPRGVVQRTAGDRWILVGDAAGAADPWTGEGIYHAQRTGQIAAEVLIENLRRDTLDRDRLAAHDRRWKRALHTFNTRYSKKASRVLFECRHHDELVDAVVETLVNHPGTRPAVAEAVGAFFAGEPFLQIQLRQLRHPALPLLVAQRMGWRAASLLTPILRAYLGRD